MTSACTILIPTHNRAAYLERCVSWFLQFDCPIVIADSSAAAWSSPKRSHDAVTYTHLPGGFEVYPEKLRRGLDAVATPLVALCADDDFITRDSFRQCTAFLQANPDYASAQGYCYQVQPFGERLVAWPLHYPFHDLHQDAWIDRVERAGSTIFYSFNRTADLRSALTFLARQDFSETAASVAGFFDTALTLNAARGGKFKRLPVPFALRDYSPLVSAVGTRHLTITSRNVPDFYRNLLEHLLQGDENPATRERLLKLFAADYAGQITYDQTVGVSRRQRVARLSPVLQQRIEYAFRCLSAARIYATPQYRPFLSLFRHPEYAQIKRIITAEVPK